VHAVPLSLFLHAHAGKAYLLLQPSELSFAIFRGKQLQDAFENETVKT
jgi:hypothetical protein